MDIQRVLLPTDFSPAAQHALQWALRFAQSNGATLHLLHIMADYEAEWFGDDDVTTPQFGAVRERLDREAREGLAQAAAAAERRGLTVRREVEYSLDVADTILAHADAIDADLIVTGTHGRKGLSHLILGSVAEKVVRRAHRPVMTVGTEAPDEPVVRHLLAPIDFSEPSKQALRLAKDLGGLFDASLDLLFVGEARTIPVFSDTGIPHLNTVKMDPEIVKNAARALEQLSKEVGGPPVPVQGHVAEGEVPEQIVRFAETREVDLLVLATRGLSGLDRLLIGSVAQHVMRTAPCPVLTINARSGNGERGS